MEIGNKIRILRTEKGVTQEQLAAALGVSPQAVSKWENDVTTPDIALLPQLSVYFGVTIDELFAIADDAHMERIRNMLSTERFLSQHDFNYAEAYLTDGLRSADRRADCLELLADLHMHRADGHREKAAQFAMEGLSLDPTRKAFHSVLCNAKRGAHRDWCVTNRHGLINFYLDFVQKNPDYGLGYQWLIDNLIGDGRLEEARTIAPKLRELCPPYYYPLYMGKIEQAAGNIDGALQHWNSMVAEYPQEWYVRLSMGDCMAQLCRYDEAVGHYRSAMELQPQPRYTDAPLSIAHIREIQGRYRDAAEAMDDVLSILREEWGISLGEGYEAPRRERDRYLALAEKQK